MPQSSIREVARHAGVSVGTVSNVLNRPDLVAEATRVRVQAAIAELGFVRNESARRLRQGPPAPGGGVVGVLIRDVANPYFTDVARGTEAVLSAHGIDALWCTSEGSRDKELRCLDFLHEHGAAAVLIMPVGQGAESVARARAHGMGVVTLDRELPRADGCTARADHGAGGALAARHLIDRGRTRLAFVTGAPNSPPCRQRQAGAVRELARDGHEPLLTLPQGDMTPTLGQEAARRLLALPRPPTGVFCANDLLAIGVVNELLRQGVRVPEDIAVIGYDDIELAATAAVPLTTVRQPRNELGQIAAELALAESGTASDHVHRHVVLAPELVVRDST
ncbi:hypothetical protein DPM19_11590 [Actinomadura craniellae]|uniref:HTH lacI-type domain-containing protein n=1 Tax=Actinomadura craniellae TaxID=2231787 RepID=A0A365H8E1_9ACTN|nr:LacI family DNA-binding transcriptional regulator [Actinomadura craniellae]RAY15341.1 hypothetical protein DPM19_11590 [Actinomadura craniellae]